MKFAVHLLLPHHSNNHRPKILHNQSLLILVFLLVVFAFLLSFAKIKLPTVLGVATNISTDQLLELTNKERTKNGLSPLFLDSQLSKAAEEKAKNMFSQNYWAHNTPDGKTPWFFIVNSGYQYTYAGENLARDFSSPGGVLSAWMASQGHKDNILSPNYQDVGFAVVNGRLNGQETTLVVQLLGARKGGTQAKLIEKQINNPQVFGLQKLVKSQSNPVINTKFLTHNIAISILGFLIIVLAVDMVIANRKRLVRLVGHNLDHIIFLGSFVSAIIINRGGAIL